MFKWLKLFFLVPHNRSNDHRNEWNVSKLEGKSLVSKCLFSGSYVPVLGERNHTPINELYSMGLKKSVFREQAIIAAQFSLKFISET